MIKSYFYTELSLEAHLNLLMEQVYQIIKDSANLWICYGMSFFNLWNLISILDKSCWILLLLLLTLTSTSTSTSQMFWLLARIESDVWELI